MGETRRLTLREAAEATGMPLDALRKRVYRGTIKATKVDGQYLIVPADLAELIEPGETSSDIGETTGETVLGRISDKGETAAQAPVLTLDYIESLKDEISFLRSQLDQRSRELADERERSDVLHREAFARIEALRAGIPTMVGSDQAPDPQDAPPGEPENAPQSPETHRTALGATETASLGNESNEASGVAHKTRFSRWWTAMRGR